MKYHIYIQEKLFSVELFPSQKAKVNGKPYAYQLANHGILVNERFISYDYFYDVSKGVHKISFSEKVIPARIGSSITKEKLRFPKEEVYSPLNGQVMKIIAKIGNLFKEGETILILEAMKMENEMSAPISGRLKEVYVKEKEIVKAGQLLFKMEPMENHSREV